MNIRVLYNVLLVRLGIRQILPSDYINGIRVIENNDPMVPLLVDESLINAGFVNYPAEWWHFSYGDKLWAAYSNKKSAMYGEIVASGSI